MRREVHREIRERQRHECRIYLKRNNNHMQYAQSSLSHLDSRSDPIGGSELVSRRETELGLFT